MFLLCLGSGTKVCLSTEEDIDDKDVSLRESSKLLELELVSVFLAIDGWIKWVMGLL